MVSLTFNRDDSISVRSYGEFKNLAGFINVEGYHRNDAWFEDCITLAKYGLLTIDGEQWRTASLLEVTRYNSVQVQIKHTVAARHDGSLVEAVEFHHVKSKEDKVAFALRDCARRDATGGLEELVELMVERFKEEHKDKKES